MPRPTRALAFLALAAAWTGAGLPISPAQAQATPASDPDEVISTAAGSPSGGAPLPVYTAPLRLHDRPDEGPGFLRPVGPCGGPAKTAEGKTDKTPHGEVWAGVGTRGYREIGGVVCLPVGENTAVTIAVDAGHMDGWGRRR
jgi:hypothetical protein